MQLKYSSKYLVLCSAEERQSQGFDTALSKVNDDRLFIFGELSF